MGDKGKASCLYGFKAGTAAQAPRIRLLAPFTDTAVVVVVHRAFDAPFAARSAGFGTAVLALMFYAGPGETQCSTFYSSFALILPVKHDCLCKSNEKGKKTGFAY